MNDKQLAIGVTLVFSVVGILGDYFLKIASKDENSLKSWAFYVGFALYASTAFAWVYIMKHLKLGTIGVLYSLTMIVLLTAIGVIFFEETLHSQEIVGLVMAIVAMILLMRFA